jgi:hypothetical protein
VERAVDKPLPSPSEIARQAASQPEQAQEHGRDNGREMD